MFIMSQKFKIFQNIEIFIMITNLKIYIKIKKL